MFVPGKPFQPSLMFVSKVGAWLRGANPRIGAWPTNIKLGWKVFLVGKAPSLESAPYNQAPALLTNIRLGWKGLPDKNTLAYYEHL